MYINYGYVLDKKMTLSELVAFQKEIQELFDAYLYYHFCKEFGIETSLLIDELTRLDANVKVEKNPEEIEEKVYNALSYSKKTIPWGEKHKEKKWENEINSLIEYPEKHTIEEVIWRKFEKKIEDSGEFSYLSTAEITIFPLPEKCLILTHGLARFFFRDLVTPDADVGLFKVKCFNNPDFVKKWNLRRYNYKSCIDCPDKVLEKEWQQREKDWKTAFCDRNIPGKNGLMIQFFSINTDIFDLYLKLKKNNFKDILEHISSTKERMRGFAYHKYCNDMYRLDKKPEKDPDLTPYMGDFTYLEITPELLEKSILDLIPSYLEFRSL